MPLLMGMSGGDRNGSSEFTPYSYFPEGSKLGKGERVGTPQAGPTVAPTPTGIPKGVASLLSTAKRVFQPVAEKAVAFARTDNGPWWILGGLTAAYLLTRRGASDAGTIQGTVGPVG